jgi:predicted secreted protein
VTLKETSTSGYLWRVGEVPEGIEYLESVFEPPSRDMPVGAGGQRRFLFRVSNQGTFVLTFELRREWEEKPLRDHEVRVEAADPN